MEEEKEKEMIQQHQVTNYRGGGGGGRDSRRGSKAAVDEWQGGKGDRERKELSREKFDQSKVAGILNKRKGIQVSAALAWRRLF